MFPTSSYVRPFSIAKETVTFHDGRKGWIVEKKKGWFSINVVDIESGLEKVIFLFRMNHTLTSCTYQIVKVRKSEFNMTSDQLTVCLSVLRFCIIIINYIHVGTEINTICC